MSEADDKSPLRSVAEIDALCIKLASVAKHGFFEQTREQAEQTRRALQWVMGKEDEGIDALLK